MFLVLTAVANCGSSTKAPKRARERAKCTQQPHMPSRTQQNSPTRKESKTRQNRERREAEIIRINETLEKIIHSYEAHIMLKHDEHFAMRQVDPFVVARINKREGNMRIIKSEGQISMSLGVAIVLKYRRA